MDTRNEALVFADRARRNLELIERSSVTDGQGHVVTQLALSLLGMVVFPKETMLLEMIERTPLSELESDDWPAWQILRDEPRNPGSRTTTLGGLVRHVRNAVAHGRLSFTSDSPHLDEVEVIVEDQYARSDSEPYFRAQIRASDLKTFCTRFLRLIVDQLG